MRDSPLYASADFTAELTQELQGSEMSTKAKDLLDLQLV